MLLPGEAIRLTLKRLAPEVGRPSRLLGFGHIRRGRVGQSANHSVCCSFDPDLQRSLGTDSCLFSPWVLSRYRPCFLGIPPRRTLKHDTVFRSSLFSDSQIPWHRLRHELSRHGGQQKARSHYPQPIRSITPSRFPWSSTLTATLNLCGNRAICLTII